MRFFVRLLSFSSTTATYDGHAHLVRLCRQHRLWGLKRGPILGRVHRGRLCRQRRLWCLYRWPRPDRARHVRLRMQLQCRHRGAGCGLLHLTTCVRRPPRLLRFRSVPTAAVSLSRGRGLRVVFELPHLLRVSHQTLVPLAPPLLPYAAPRPRAVSGGGLSLLLSAST